LTNSFLKILKETWELLNKRLHLWCIKGGQAFNPLLSYFINQPDQVICIESMLYIRNSYILLPLMCTFHIKHSLKLKYQICRCKVCFHILLGYDNYTERDLIPQIIRSAYDGGSLIMSILQNLWYSEITNLYIIISS